MRAYELEALAAERDAALVRLERLRENVSFVRDSLAWAAQQVPGTSCGRVLNKAVEGLNNTLNGWWGS